MARVAGILMPITSLPTPYGIGTIGKEAREFADFLSEAGQKIWQILPAGPTSYGDSPYQSFSTYAGNPYLIDLDTLVEEELISKEQLDAIDWGESPNEVDYEKIYNNRFMVLRKAYGVYIEDYELDVFDEFKKDNKLTFISYGSREVENTRGQAPYETVEEIKKLGVNAVYYESPLTAHEWQTWRRSLYKFAPLLFK